MSDSAVVAAPKYQSEPAEPPEPRTVEEAIDRLEGELAAAKAAKEKADIQFTAVDGQLAALNSLKRDGDKVTQAYRAVHGQLTITQQDFDDYVQPERENLEKLLGDKGVADVRDEVEKKAGLDTGTADAVVEKKEALAEAERASTDAEADRRAKADAVTRYKQLPATIGAAHTRLKALRDEVVKARQAGQYALAFWLLTRPDFNRVLGESAGLLIEPDALPATLLSAVNALSDAEKAKAERDQEVADRRIVLAGAERAAAEQRAKGEADLRDALRAITPAKA